MQKRRAVSVLSVFMTFVLGAVGLLLYMGAQPVSAGVLTGPSISITNGTTNRVNIMATMGGGAQPFAGFNAHVLAVAGAGVTLNPIGQDADDTILPLANGADDPTCAGTAPTAPAGS